MVVSLDSALSLRTSLGIQTEDEIEANALAGPSWWPSFSFGLAHKFPDLVESARNRFRSGNTGPRDVPSELQTSPATKDPTDPPAPVNPDDLRTGPATKNPTDPPASVNPDDLRTGPATKNPTDPPASVNPDDLRTGQQRKIQQIRLLPLIQMISEQVRQRKIQQIHLLR